MRINNKKIIEEVALEMGLPISAVDNVIQSIFRFIRNTIKGGTFQSIRLMHFGIFVAKKNIDYFKNKPEKKKNALERLKNKGDNG